MPLFVDVSVLYDFFLWQWLHISWLGTNRDTDSDECCAMWMQSICD